ncbi:MAG: hypothetical protein ACM338_02055, partial [Betaproteobacteria bacterium]
MKICIVSDQHARRELLARAASEANALGARSVPHCDNQEAPSTLHAIIGFGAADSPAATQLKRTSLIVVGPAVRIKRRLCAAMGRSAQWQRPKGARWLARASACPAHDGRWHAPARHRAEAIVDGCRWQVLRRSNSKASSRPASPRLRSTDRVGAILRKRAFVRDAPT